jgi:hypothetical protein
MNFRPPPRVTETKEELCMESPTFTKMSKQRVGGVSRGRFSARQTVSRLGFAVGGFGIFALMLTEIGFALKRGDNPTFDFLFGLIVICIVIALILWDRRYRRRWQQFRAEDWPQVEGIFVPGEGEVVTMRRGSSKADSVYEVWLYYEYQCYGEQDGIYTHFSPPRRKRKRFLEFSTGRKSR